MKDFRSYFIQSRKLFVSKYLKASPEDLNRLLIERRPNLEEAVEAALGGISKALLPDFWEKIRDILMRSGYWDLFRKWGASILVAVKEIKATEAEVWLLADLGWLSMEEGNYLVAEKRLSRARKVALNLKENYLNSVVERYLGVLAYRKSNFALASRKFSLALALINEKQQPGIVAEVLNLQGSIAKKENKYDEAEVLYKKSLKLLGKTKDVWNKTGVLRNMARLEAQRGNPKKARGLFRKTIALCKKIGRKDMLFGCCLMLAKVEITLRNYERAKALALQAREGFLELGMSLGYAEADKLLNQAVRKSSSR